MKESIVGHIAVGSLTEKKKVLDTKMILEHVLK